MEPLSEREVVIKGTQFKFLKALPMEALRVFETIRPGLSAVLTEAKIDFELLNDRQSETAMMVFGQQLVGAFSMLPQDTVEAMQKGLFPFTQYKGPGMNAFVPVSGDADSAFKELEVVHIYELLARAFYVNFSGSVSEITSRYLNGLALSQPKAET